MCASRAGDPLSFFRDIVGNFLDELPLQEAEAADSPEK